jgi:hypothetical protein
VEDARFSLTFAPDITEKEIFNLEQIFFLIASFLGWLQSSHLLFSIKC